MYFEKGVILEIYRQAFVRLYNVSVVNSFADK